MAAGFYQLTGYGQPEMRDANIDSRRRTFDSNVTLETWDDGPFPFRFDLSQKEGKFSTSWRPIYPPNIFGAGLAPCHVRQKLNFEPVESVYSINVQFSLSYFGPAISVSKSLWLEILGDQRYEFIFRGFKFWQTQPVELPDNLENGRSIHISVPVIGLVYDIDLFIDFIFGPLSIPTSRLLPVSRTESGYQGNIEFRAVVTAARLDLDSAIALKDLGKPLRDTIRLVSNEYLRSQNVIRNLASSSPLWWTFH